MPEPASPKDCYFLLGKNNLEVDEPGSFKSSVSHFLSHPDWDVLTDRRDADIAIAVLENRVEYSQFIRSICLYSKQSDNLYGRVGTISGWGATEKNPKKASEVALEVNVTVAEPINCVLDYPELAKFFGRKSLCVLNQIGSGSGACSGKILV